MSVDPRGLRPSATFPPHVLAEIHRAADQGLYEIRGFGTKRKLPTFDDLLFLGASVSRYPLEGYREKCATDVWLGTRFAKKPIHLKIPITIAGMSFGALGANAKEAIGRACTEIGTSSTTGDGGMTEEERQSSKTLVYQVLPSRYGLNPDDLRRCDAIEVVVGQGAKPGGGGMLLGMKITERVAKMRDLPVGIDQRSACRHPDWTGPDDLTIKIQELREITNWEKPIYVKVGATRTRYDVALAVKAGADVVVVDGMQGGTAATQDVFIEHVGIPDPAGGAPGGGSPAGARHAPQGAAHRLRRHPQRRRCRQGAGHGRRCGLHRLGGHGGAGLQQAGLYRGLPRARDGARHVPPLPYRPLPGRRHDPGSRSCRSASTPGAGRALAAQLSLGDGAGAADRGAGLRQEPCPQSRARRSRGAHRRGRGHGRSAAGGNRLDSRPQRVIEFDEARQETDKGDFRWQSISPKAAKDRKIKYFLISYVDLFGGLRAKLVPAAAIGGMQRDGAGFAGFATWLDMTPADSDLFARPDPESLIQLPWKPEVGWLAAISGWTARRSPLRRARC